MNDNINHFVYPVQTKEMRKNNEDPRIKVSDMLQGAKRLEGESFEDYKMRMKVEKQLTREQCNHRPPATLGSKTKMIYLYVIQILNTIWQ